MKFSVLATAPLLTALAAALVIPHDANSITAFSEHARGSSAVAEAPYGVQDINPKHGSSPLYLSAKSAQNKIEDSYIVVFKKDVDPDRAAKHHTWVAEAHANALSTLRKRDSQHPFLSEGFLSGLQHAFDFGDSLRGYSGKFAADTIDLIRQSDEVLFVEHDSRVFASDFDVETGAPWGLARVSHRDPLSLGSFNKYLYDSEGGDGVDVYVIDTGTNVAHEDFEGRAKWGKTIPDGDADEDGNGHGSHCSGTIAGKQYGVSKKANIVAVKVLRSNGSGTMSDVLKGVEYAASQHIKNIRNKKKGYKGAAANMSLGGGKSPSLDLAVNAAVKAGIHFAVAAGNDNADACDYSPAAAENAVTVGATALSDDRAYFSNYGKCVDVFAPGVNILSTYTGSPSALATLSGTSMASPHIAGLLAYFLSLQPSSDSLFATSGPVSPAQLKKNLISYGTKGIITDLDADSPNVLAYNGAGGNLTSFWTESADGAVAEDAEVVDVDWDAFVPGPDVEEDTVAYLPVEEVVRENLDRVSHEVEGVIEALRAGLGLAV